MFFEFFIIIFLAVDTFEYQYAIIDSRSDLQFLHLSLWSPLARLSDRLDSELDINLTLLMNFILYGIALPFSFSFLTGTENLMYFSMFSPKYSNCSSKLFCQLSDYKIVVIIRTIMEHH